MPFLMISIQASAYCNLDTFNLADFSVSGYQNKCKKGDVARVKRENARLYCDKTKGMEVVTVAENGNTVIFECVYINVRNQQRARVYRWTDNSGNIQFTNNPPPADCMTPECSRIRQEISAEEGQGLDKIMDNAISRYYDKRKEQGLNKKKRALTQNPTIRDYFEAQTTRSLCRNLQTDEDSSQVNQLMEKLKELYTVKDDAQIRNDFAWVLSRRFSIDAKDILKLFGVPSSVWIGMHESLLHCTRPVADFVYEPASRFGAPLKQYIYEVGTIYEYVDVKDGIVTNIRTLPVSPAE